MRSITARSNRIENGIRHRGGSVGALCGSHQPMAMVSRHRHEFAAAMPRNFHCLALSLMLEIAEAELNSKAVARGMATMADDRMTRVTDSMEYGKRFAPFVYKTRPEGS